MFLKKSKDLLDIKTQKQTYLDYRHMIQLCVVIFASNLLILCLQVDVFTLDFKKNDKTILNYFK